VLGPCLKARGHRLRRTKDMATIDEQQRTEEQAFVWIARLRERNFEDWPDFRAWLEDPKHAEVYHEMAVADLELDVLLAPTAVHSATRMAWTVPVAAAIGVAAIAMAFVSAHLLTAQLRLTTPSPNPAQAPRLHGGQTVQDLFDGY
jgi:hypothetical protein